MPFISCHHPNVFLQVMLGEIRRIHSRCTSPLMYEKHINDLKNRFQNRCYPIPLWNQALKHAERAGCQRVCIQTDSLLVANHMNCAWACRSRELQPLLDKAWAVCARMRARGTEVLIEHVYREYNKLADALANIAVNTMSSTSTTWRARQQADRPRRRRPER